MQKILFAFLALICVAAAAGPLTNEPVVGSDPGATPQTRYRCYKSGGGPARCVVLYDDGTTATLEQAAETLDWPTFLAAMRAANTGQPTPILVDGGGPIEACGNSHGKSACCYVVKRMPGLDAVDIECP